MAGLTAILYNFPFSLVGTHLLHNTAQAFRHYKCQVCLYFSIFMYNLPQKVKLISLLLLHQQLLLDLHFFPFYNLITVRMSILVIKKQLDSNASLHNSNL